MADSDYMWELREELGSLNTALKNMLSNGQEHDIIGSYRFKGVSYKSLRKRRSQVISQLAALNGGKSTVLHDFS